MGRLKGVDFPEFCVKNFQINKFEYVEDDLYPPPGSEHWLNIDKDEFDEYFDDCISQINKKVKEAKLGFNDGQIICIALRNDFTEPEDDKRQNDVKRIKKWLVRANANEIPLARIYIGRRPLSEKNQENNKKTQEDIEKELEIIKKRRENVIKCIEEILPVAEKEGVKLAIENHGGRNENPKDIINILNHFESPWLGVCLDLGNIYKDKLENYLNVLAKQTIHVHAKTYPTEGILPFPGVDYERCVNTLKKAGYEGYWTIEYEEFTTKLNAQVDGVIKTLNLLQTQDW
jgi:sugar phosphate isomerase/epimerase